MSDVCTGGPAVNPCPNGPQVRVKFENGGVEYVCWRHLVPILRPVVDGGRAPRITLKGV